LRYDTISDGRRSANPNRNLTVRLT